MSAQTLSQMRKTYGPSAAPIIEELDRRLAEHRAEPSSVIPWEDVREEILATARRRKR